MNMNDPIEEQIKTFLSCYGKDTLRSDASFGSFSMGLYRHRGKANILFYGRNMAYKLVCDPESAVKEGLSRYRMFKRQNEQLEGIGFRTYKDDFFSMKFETERKDYYIFAFRKMVADRSRPDNFFNFVETYDSDGKSMMIETDDMVYAVHKFLGELPFDKTMGFPDKLRDFITEGN